MEAAAGMINAASPREAVAAHYRTLLGPPSREAVFRPPGGAQIGVWKWDKRSSGQGVNVYATLGAADALAVGEKRVEFLVGLEPEADDVAEALAEAALHGVGTGRSPAFGDTLTLAYPLWRGTRMRSFLFTTGGEEKIAPLVEPVQVDFVQLVPLFENEVEFKRRNGEQALWALFRSVQAPYWDPRRRSALEASA
jgi:hypothetical protein